MADFRKWFLAFALVALLLGAGACKGQDNADRSPPVAGAQNVTIIPLPVTVIADPPKWQTQYAVLTAPRVCTVDLKVDLVLRVPADFQASIMERKVRECHYLPIPASTFLPLSRQ